MGAVGFSFRGAGRARRAHAHRQSPVRLRLGQQHRGNTAKKYWTSVVWEPAKAPAPGTDSNFTHANTRRDGAGKVLDFFCGGETVLPAGRVMCVGGTAKYPDDAARTTFAGRTDTLLFDPATQQWTMTRPMAHGRWYPSVITLGDGRALVSAGFDEHAHGDPNTTLESRFHLADYWQTIAMPTGFGGVPLFAHMYLLATDRCSTQAGIRTTPQQRH